MRKGTTNGRGRLRVLVADENEARLDLVADVVEAAGHFVAARVVQIDQVQSTIVYEQPDVAIVAPGADDDHALALVEELVETSTCPVVLFMERADPGLVAVAAERGVFGQLMSTDPAELQGELEIVLRRYEDYRRLEEAFGRRAVVERAKGILMERHGIDEREAFERLRAQARGSGTRLAAVAQALLDAHLLLP